MSGYSPRVRTPAALAVALLLASGCGRSWFEPQVTPRTCTLDPELPGAGCRYLAAPGLHLVDVTAERIGLELDEAEPDGVFVVNPSDRDPLQLRIRLAHEPYAEEERTVDPGGRTIVELPARAQPDATARRDQDIVELLGDRPFVATMFQPFRSFVGNDSELLLPVEALGERYVVAAYPPHPAQFQGAGEPAFFELLAGPEGATVRWRPSAPTVGDGDDIPSVASGAWSPSVALAPGEALRVTGASAPPTQPDAGDLSGTLVEADAPIAVIAGNRCASVPPTTDGYAGCDPLVEQLLPVALWEDAIAVPHPPLRTRESHHVRVFAGAAGLTLHSSPPVLPAEPTVLAAEGDYVDLVVPHGTSFEVSADGPILAVGYLTTRDPSDQIGDPSMYQLVPPARWLADYTVTTGTQWSSHLLQATRRRGGAAVEIDGNVVAGWTAVGEGYEAAVVEVDEGVHAVRSGEAFGLTQFGWTNDIHDACQGFAGVGSCQTSYAHPAGLDLR